MKIVFLGTPAIAATCLEAIHQSGRHRILAVGTHPDRPQKRGLHLLPTAVKETALRLGLPVVEVPDAKDPAFAKALRSLDADLLVVVAFVILPPEVLASTRLGAVNLHGSLLPRWRGAAPVQRSVEAGETVTGATVFRLDSGVDTGGIVATQSVQVGPDETSGEVLGRMAALGGDLLLKALDHLESHPDDRGLAQDPALVCKAPKLFPEEGRIDWSLPARRIHDKIRAFNPAPGAWTRPDGKLLKIWKTHVLTDSVQAPAGQAVRIADGRVVAGCAEGALELVEVQPEGRARQAGRDWFNGLRSPGPVPLS
ncbi:MAG TPA: methionyl-tRNA formyltransferase [Fibrobacteria bacterium]|nr:methionyl-tRNA formyltransferase [Fibrobacteria bacterium]HOX53029.1 methionyl-tRNA formyltransferase [Fibrobacteria bacterium]